MKSLYHRRKMIQLMMPRRMMISFFCWSDSYMQKPRCYCYVVSCRHYVLHVTSVLQNYRRPDMELYNSSALLSVPALR